MKDTLRFPWEDPSVSMFKVWVGQPELAWARRAWIALEKQGLTLFSNEVERTQVLIRAMTLGTIYREFCDIALEEEWEPEDLIWAEEMKLSPFRVAQIVGTNPEYELGDKEREHELYESALRSLIDEYRTEICEALCMGFDGEAMLFVSLWNSRKAQKDESDVDEDDGEEDDSSPDFVLGDATPQKADAYAWIRDGMPRYR